MTDRRPSLFRSPEAANEGYTKIPNVVLFSAALTDGQVRLYAALLSYHRPGGWVYPGRHKLAARLGCSTDTIDRDMKRLRYLGLALAHRRGQGKTNLYELPEVQGPTLDGLAFVDESAHKRTLESELTRTHEEDEG